MYIAFGTPVETSLPKTRTAPIARLLLAVVMIF